MALEQWPAIDSEKDKQIARAWHNLWHFASDGDIRVRDPRYAAYQRELLEEDITALKKKLQEK